LGRRESHWRGGGVYERTDIQIDRQRQAGRQAHAHTRTSSLVSLNGKPWRALHRQHACTNTRANTRTNTRTNTHTHRNSKPCRRSSSAARTPCPPPAVARGAHQLGSLTAFSTALLDVLSIRLSYSFQYGSLGGAFNKALLDVLSIRLSWRCFQ